MLAMLPSARIFPEMQHRHLVRDPLHKFHVVLDDQDRAVLADAIEQRGGLLALRRTHAGDRFIEHQQLGVLHEQHADFQPLLLTMTEKCSLDFEILLQKDFLRNRLNPPDHFLRTSKGKAAKHASTRGIRDFEVFEDRKVFVNRRRLKLPPDAGVDDLVLLPCPTVRAA